MEKLSHLILLFFPFVFIFRAQVLFIDYAKTKKGGREKGGRHKANRTQTLASCCSHRTWRPCSMRWGETYLGSHPPQPHTCLYHLLAIWSTNLFVPTCNNSNCIIPTVQLSQACKYLGLINDRQKERSVTTEVWLSKGENGKCFSKLKMQTLWVAASIPLSALKRE